MDTSDDVRRQAVHGHPDDEAFVASEATLAAAKLKLRDQREEMRQARVWATPMPTLKRPPGEYRIKVVRKAKKARDDLYQLGSDLSEPGSELFCYFPIGRQMNERCGNLGIASIVAGSLRKYCTPHLDKLHESAALFAKVEERTRDAIAAFSAPHSSVHAVSAPSLMPSSVPQSRPGVDFGVPHPAPAPAPAPGVATPRSPTDEMSIPCDQILSDSMEVDNPPQPERVSAQDSSDGTDGEPHDFRYNRLRHPIVVVPRSNVDF